MGDERRYYALFVPSQDTPETAYMELAWLNGRMEAMSQEEVRGVVSRCWCEVVCMEVPRACCEHTRGGISPGSAGLASSEQGLPFKE